LDQIEDPVLAARKASSPWPRTERVVDAGPGALTPGEQRGHNVEPTYRRRRWCMNLQDIPSLVANDALGRRCREFRSRAEQDGITSQAPSLRPILVRGGTAEIPRREPVGAKVSQVYRDCQRRPFRSARSVPGQPPSPRSHTSTWSKTLPGRRPIPPQFSARSANLPAPGGVERNRDLAAAVRGQPRSRGTGSSPVLSRIMMDSGCWFEKKTVCWVPRVAYNTWHPDCSLEHGPPNPPHPGLHS